MQGSSAPSAREALDKIKEYISSLVCLELRTFGLYISPGTVECTPNFAVVVFGVLLLIISRTGMLISFVAFCLRVLLILLLFAPCLTLDLFIRES
jgi:hypothetical protein